MFIELFVKVNEDKLKRLRLFKVLRDFEKKCLLFNMYDKSWRTSLDIICNVFSNT